MKYSRGFSILTVVLLIAIALLGFFLWNKTDTVLGGQIIYTEGVVEYKEIDGEWKRVSGDVDVSEGYSIEVVGEGKAIINLDDGSVLRLNSDSGVTLESLNPNHIVVKNDKGEIYSRVANLDRIFEVKDGEFIYESLGTAYKTINKEKIKGVIVYHNQVKIKDSEGNEKIIIKEGKKYYVKSEDFPEKVEIELDVLEIEIKNDDFVVWNKIEDEKDFNGELGVLKTENIQKEEEVKKKVENSSGGITLSGQVVNDGIKFRWDVNGVNVDSGFKLVKSIELNPVYPGDEYSYISDGSKRSYVWKLTDGKTRYFRICQYLGGKCGVYSDNIKVTAPTKSSEKPKKEVVSEAKSISLSGNGNIVNWTVDGYSKSGFKVVWSKNEMPTYPTRNGDKYRYLSNPEALSAELSIFDGDGKYFVRVCEYLGGKCGIYSNQIDLNLVK